jgi:hypothetical protein
MTASRAFKKKPGAIELTQHLGQPVNCDTCFLNEFDLALEFHLMQNEFS